MQYYDQSGKPTQNNGYPSPYPAEPAPQPNVVYGMQTQDPGLSASTANLVSESAEEPYTCLYVMSVLASLFCTSLPCGLIGLMHIIAARADYSRGSHNLARKKRGQALCWTAWSCGLGFGVLLIAVIYMGVILGAASTAVVTSERDIYPAVHSSYPTAPSWSG